MHLSVGLEKNIQSIGMASGQIHTLTTLCASAVAVSYFGLDNIEGSSGWLLGGLWCVIVSPDLDQVDGDNGYYGLYVLSNTKRGLEKLWHLYWQPYARLLKHRSFFSHFPVIGTFGRLIYGGLVYIPLLAFWDGTPYFITAIITMDFLHWVLDWKLWGVFRLFKQ